MKKQEIRLFENTEFGRIREITIDGEPWFVGKDVCEAFGDTNYRRSLGNIDGCDKCISQIKTAGGVQNMTIINESGLYSLLFQMQPQKAKGVSQNEHRINERIEKLHRFKHWVTSEVLPAIRKTGGYIMGEKEMSADELLSKALLIAQAKIADKEAKIMEQEEIINGQEVELQDKDNTINHLQTLRKIEKPYVQFANSVITSENDIDFADYAAYLQNDYNIDYGRNKIMQFCRDRGFLCGSQKDWNRPSQRIINQGYMSYKVVPIRIGGKRCLRFKPLLTGKGQHWLYKQIKDWCD